MIRVLGIGDNVCDKYLHSKKIYPGGNALNIAVFGKFLGAEAAYLGTIGDDEVGQHVYTVVKELGIDLTHCRMEEGENGCARVCLVEGDRVFLPGNRGGVSRIHPPVLTKLDEAYLSGFDLIHTSIFSFLEQELPKIRRAGRFVSMDFSNQYSEDYLRQCCPYLDCAAISCGSMPLDEIQRTMEQILNFGCRQMVIATRGGEGACVMIQSGRADSSACAPSGPHTAQQPISTHGTAQRKLYLQSSYLVEAKDTMGAGDSFIASFLVNYLEGMSDCADFHVCYGSHGITSAEEYRDMLVKISLYRAALFASGQCQRDGSFGFGKDIELTEEDLSVMKESGL